MKKTDNLQGAITILALALIGAALIVVFQRSGGTAEDYTDTSTPAEAFISAVMESVTIEQPASTEPVKTETAPQTAKAPTKAETRIEPYKSLLKPFNETTTEAPEPEPQAEYADYEYQDEGTGAYIGYFRLTAYEWTGSPMRNGEYPYYGACACNRPELWGKYLYIEGHGTFKVCDTGNVNVMGYDTIDIYLGDAASCDNFGVQWAEVYYG